MFQDPNEKIDIYLTLAKNQDYIKNGNLIDKVHICTIKGLIEQIIVVKHTFVTHMHKIVCIWSLVLK